MYGDVQGGDSGLGVPVGHAAMLSKLPWHTQVWDILGRGCSRPTWENHWLIGGDSSQKGRKAARLVCLTQGLGREAYSQEYVILETRRIAALSGIRPIHYAHWHLFGRKRK